MAPRVSLIALAVADVARSRHFSIEGLGWPVHLEAAGVLMIRAGERLLLSLWDESEFVAEVGPVRTGAGVAPITLAHNVGTDAEVEAVLTAAHGAGAAVFSAQRRAWGGWSGYFADPTVIGGRSPAPATMVHWLSSCLSRQPASAMERGAFLTFVGGR